MRGIRVENNNEVPSTNGWPEYKRSVLYQLEYLTDEVHALREVNIVMNKELSTFITKDSAEIQKNVLATELAVTTKENNQWKMDISNQLASQRGESEKGRRTLAIVLVVITIFINFIGLFIEMKLR